MPTIVLNKGTTKFTLKLIEYKKYNENIDNLQWCSILLEVKNYYMNFGKKLNDIVTNKEMEQLVDLLENLLLGKNSSNTKLYFEAPDLSFESYKIDNSIWLDITINFPTNDNVYDAEKWIVSLDCEELTALYLGLLTEIFECENSTKNINKNKMEELKNSSKDYLDEETSINSLIDDNIKLLDTYDNLIPKENEFLCIVATYGNYGKEYTFLCRKARTNVIWRVEGKNDILNFKRYVILKKEQLPVPLEDMKYAIPTEIVSY